MITATLYIGAAIMTAVAVLREYYKNGTDFERKGVTWERPDEAAQVYGMAMIMGAGWPVTLTFAGTFLGLMGIAYGLKEITMLVIELTEEDDTQ